MIAFFRIDKTNNKIKYSVTSEWLSTYDTAIEQWDI